MGVVILPILGCLVWIIMEVVLGSVVIATTVLMVATTNRVREFNDTLFIHIAGEAAFPLTLRAGDFTTWLDFALPFHWRVLTSLNPKVQKCIVQK